MSKRERIEALEARVAALEASNTPGGLGDAPDNTPGGLSALIPLQPLPSPLERPTLDIPEAGAYLGLSRIQSYRAAKDGHLPTVQVSERRYKVPTAALRTMLGLPSDGDAA